MLYDKLIGYSKSGIYPFHMPGHKRNLLDEIIPYQIDITEIADFDNLHNANGILKNISKRAADLYSVKYANLLVNGATGGILAAIRSLTNYGDKVVAARNCHKSVYNAIELLGLDAQYIMPDINSEFGIFSSVTAEAVQKVLEKNTNVKLVIITSPTYEGVVSDIKSISEVCHKHNALLFVDEAHGAHFPFCDYFPDEAVCCGADAVVTSLHKTLPSLTQTALLLTNSDEYKSKLDENLSIFETSSPSYILMASIEKCLNYLENSECEFLKYKKRIIDFYCKCKNLNHLKLIDSGNDFYAFDKSKLVISTSCSNINGIKLAKLLKEKYLIETEMAYTDYIIAMTSVCDSDAGFIRLINALTEIDSRINTNSTKENDFNYCLPEKVFKSSEKFNYQCEKVLFTVSENRTSLEYIWAYPPGIPILVPGEKISSNIIDYIYYLSANGVEVYSSSGNAPKYINVCQID